jgi:hypothetical protein
MMKRRWQKFLTIIKSKRKKTSFAPKVACNIAALRWVPRGRFKPPVIQYMLIDVNLEYLIWPKEILVTQVETTLEKIFHEIEAVSKERPLKIHYKSIVKGYWAHRWDSAQFHRKVNQYLARNGLLDTYHKTAFLLKKAPLQQFKQALYFLDIDCKTRGEAYVAHLWTIALKVTKGRLYDVIKQIWKKRYGVKRLSKEMSEQFREFYSLCNRSLGSNL